MNNIWMVSACIWVLTTFFEAGNCYKDRPVDMQHERIAHIVRQPPQAASGSACLGQTNANYERYGRTHAYLGG